MTARRLTYAEAAVMPRRDVVDRVYAEMQRWNTRPPRTDAQRAAYGELTRIMHDMLDPAAGIQAAMDLLAGRPNDYWDTPAGHDISREGHGDGR